MFNILMLNFIVTYNFHYVYLNLERQIDKLFVFGCITVGNRCATKEALQVEADTTKTNRY